LSSLLANIVLSVLDEHVMAPWQPGAEMGTTYRRHGCRQLGLPTWRIVHYADDFVVLVHGTRADVETLQENITHVLQPLGLSLSAAKIRIVHMADGFDFLGFPHPVETQMWNEQVIRLHIHRPTTCPGREGENACLTHRSRRRTWVR
jgi:retron-type reverse transcriptase